MTKAAPKDFWLKARDQVAAPARRARRRHKDFALRISLERTTLVKLPLFRYSIAFEGKPIPHSFALQEDFNGDFRTPGSEPLPIELQIGRPTEALVEIDFELPEAYDCMGLGERYGGLNLRSRVHTLLTTDDHLHLENSNALYKSIPVLYLVGPKGSRLLFLDSPAPQRWDLDSRLDEHGKIEVHTRRGFRIYVAGPAPLPELARLYTELTGRTPLPPRWSLGHQQSRWSYPTEKSVRQIAREFRQRQIPCDTVVVDIDYLDNYRVFSISRERFPHFERMTSELRQDGFHVVPIVDPGVAQSRKDPVYLAGTKEDIFCKTSTGKPFVGRVWAGKSCFPDFLLERTRAFWGKRIQALLDQGASGIWNDMNEPALFGQQRPFEPTHHPLPPKSDQLFMQTTPEGPEGHFEVRGLYGMQMARAAWEAQAAHRPYERPFTLTRSTFAGGQRYGAVWLGDNCSWFEHLRLSIPMLLNIGLSGFPFAGVDVGGFGSNCDAELLVRWYQLGIFYPFFRNHCALGQANQEPWAFGSKVEAIIRKLIAARYSLIRYLEVLFVEHYETGAPLMRPLAYHYPEDRNARSIDDQFLFGRDLLVTPILQRGKRDRIVYFPKGVFESFDHGHVVEGPSYKRVTWGFDDVPAFVRHGSILPFSSAVQHVGELNDASLTLRCYGAKASGRLWLDDGESLALNNEPHGDYRLTLANGRFTAEACHRQPFRFKCPVFVRALGKKFAFELP
jgi:alpha-glucosidase